MFLWCRQVEWNEFVNYCDDKVDNAVFGDDSLIRITNSSLTYLIFMAMQMCIESLWGLQTSFWSHLSSKTFLKGGFSETSHRLVERVRDDDTACWSTSRKLGQMMILQMHLVARSPL